MILLTYEKNNKTVIVGAYESAEDASIEMLRYCSATTEHLDIDLFCYYDLTIGETATGGTGFAPICS